MEPNDLYWALAHLNPEECSLDELFFGLPGRDRIAVLFGLLLVAIKSIIFFLSFESIELVKSMGRKLLKYHLTCKGIFILVRLGGPKLFVEEI